MSPYWVLVLHVYILKDYSICPGLKDTYGFMVPAQGPLGTSLHPAHGPECQTAPPKASVLTPGEVCSKCQSPPPSLVLLAQWTSHLYHSLVSGPDLSENVNVKKLILIYAQALVHFGYGKGTKFLSLAQIVIIFFHWTTASIKFSFYIQLEDTFLYFISIFVLF